MYAIGVDVGGMSLKIGIVNDKGEVLDSFAIPTNESFSGKETIIDLANQIKHFIDKNKYQIAGIGIGVPGLINTEECRIINLTNLKKWNGLKLDEIITPITGLPVRITNDANAAAYGETVFGSAKEFKSAVMLTLGTGVGGGVVLDGVLFEGNKGQGAELGHSTFMYNGIQCGCGRKGCFEQYASATALIRQTKEKMMQNKNSLMWKLVGGDIDKVNGVTAWDAEKQGDKVAKEVIEQYVSYLGDGMCALANIFRPEAFILSGGIAKQGDYLNKKLEKYVKEHNYGFEKATSFEIRTATLGYQSGIIGAACLFLNAK